MCKKATCSTCNKATWWGCGQHIPSVMDSIPAAERCACTPKKEVDGKEYPPMGPAFDIFGSVKAAFGFGGGNADQEGKGKGEL